MTTSEILPLSSSKHKIGETYLYKGKEYVLLGEAPTVNLVYVLKGRDEQLIYVRGTYFEEFFRRAKKSGE